MKVDLVMWAKNGAKTLPLVLRRIDEVIPERSVNKKIFVDDHSTDHSVEIAKSFNWGVYENEEGFVSGGASEALKRVTSPFFVSVEQDVILARDWWVKIPKYMSDPNVAVAQGIRLPTTRSLRALFMNWYEKDPQSLKMTTFDNNIFKSKMIREVGIPMQCPISVDLNLRDKLKLRGYKWVTDTTVVSDHIRFGIISELIHSRKIFFLAKRKQSTEYYPVRRLAKIFLTSPLVGLQVALKKRCPEVVFVYPLMRLNTLQMRLAKRPEGREFKYTIGKNGLRT